MPIRVTGRRGASGRRALAAGLVAPLVVAIASAGAGCKKPRSAKKITRDQDAQPVVVVDNAAETVRMVEEREPNDEVAQAFALERDAGARGSLDGETDVDTFAIAVTEPGLLTARLGGIEDVDLMLDLLDAEGNALARSDRGPAKTVEGIAGFPVAQGTYYLTVREFISKRKARRRAKGEPGRTGPSPVYELTAKVAPAPAKDHEHEPNDSADGARELLLGDEGFGHIGWARDTDLWKLSVEGFSEQYSLDVDLDGVPGVTLTLEILDSSGAPVLRRAGEKDGGIQVRNLVPVVAGAGGEPGTEPGAKTGAQAGAQAGSGTSGDAGGRHYYAKITARRSNPVETYRIRVATRLLELDEEIEPNDQSEQATPLRAEGEQGQEGKRRGFLTVGDTDWYRLEAGPEPVLLSVEVVPGGDVDATVTVATDAGTQAMANGGKRGEREYASAVRIPAGQAAMVEVSGSGGLGTGAAYELVWTIEPDRGQSDDSGEPGGDVDDLLGDYGE